MAEIHRNNAHITRHLRDRPQLQGLTLLLAAAIRPPRIPIVRPAGVPAAVVALTAVVEGVLLIAVEAALTATVSLF
jgi:hypothetical protein